jgi:aminopeptidase
MCVEAFYKAGSGKVTVEWTYEPLTLLNVKYCSVEALSEVTHWQEERLKLRTERLPAILHLISEDPDGLNKMDFEKFATVEQNVYSVIKPYQDAMEDKYQWCIAGVPSVEWAKKVFPKLSKKQGVEKLWEYILKTSRAFDGDPIANWKAHNKIMHRRCDYLTSLNLKTLRYKNSVGTDFTVGLIPDSRFLGGSEKDKTGREYNPNIPTEECFISPKRGEAEGIVYSTMPLSYEGTLIDSFFVRFEKGKVVEIASENAKHTEILKKMISMDEGAAYLGEVALIDKTSPIKESGILFYNTLYDENASCHLALGRGFAPSLKNFAGLTNAEQFAAGINDSMIHTDFMLGSDDLSIIGTTKDGGEVVIFENGLWAF